ncbi:YbbN family protein [Planctomicrobium piriforme]|nr:hypothetical protein [Planctomicrobium piriforme]
MAEILRFNSALFVHFWADWDGNDPVLDRTIQQLMPEFEWRVRFFSCETDNKENWELLQRLNLKTVSSTSVLFLPNRHPRVIFGCQPLGVLSEELKRCLAGQISIESENRKTFSRELNIPLDWLTRPI